MLMLNEIHNYANCGAELKNPCPTTPLFILIRLPFYPWTSKSVYCM